MIPILSSIIVSQAGKERPTALKGLGTSLVYVPLYWLVTLLPFSWAVISGS